MVTPQPPASTSIWDTIRRKTLPRGPKGETKNDLKVIERAKKRALTKGKERVSNGVCREGTAGRGHRLEHSGGEGNALHE
eukprot:6196189-Pleurochrysis_carterae.AAC.2